MIQIKNKIGSLAPDILSTKGVVETEILKSDFKPGLLDFNFDSGVYGCKPVKDELMRLQNSKCCFCESKIDAISYGDVEHFRPKGGWVQDDEKMNKPGYYWLAYNWDNLLLCCTLCNQRYKKNYFPILENSPRAINHHLNIDAELPAFIHPVFDNPEEYIEFNEEVPKPVDNNYRGKITIQKLGLDRKPLNERRKTTLNMIIDIYELANDFPDNPPHMKEKAKNKIIKYYHQSGNDDTEYASMLRSYFRLNPINF